MLFGCYRKDEANDPEVYAAAIAAILEGYSRQVVDRATDPRTGIASTCKWLPAVAEVKECCEAEQARLHRMAQKPLRRSSFAPWQWVKPPGCAYVGMLEKHGRPIGRFERENDRWNRIASK